MSSAKKSPIDIYEQFRTGDIKKDTDAAIKILALVILEGTHKENELNNELRYAYIVMQITKLFLYEVDESDPKE